MTYAMRTDRPPAMARVLYEFAEAADASDPEHGLALVRCTEGRTYVGQVADVAADGWTFTLLSVGASGDFADFPVHIPTETVLAARFATLDDAERIAP